MQKSTISKEELKSVCNLLLSEDSLTVEPRPLVSMQFFIAIFFTSWTNLDQLMKNSKTFEIFNQWNDP